MVETTAMGKATVTFPGSAPAWRYLRPVIPVLVAYGPVLGHIVS
jgi:hypothetical protein